MSIAPSRRLRLLIAHADGERIVAHDSDLPAVEIDVGPGEPTSAAAVRWLAEAGLQPWLVESVVDQSEDHQLGESPRQAFIEAAPAPTGWQPPAPWSWVAATDVRPVVPAPIAAATELRLTEFRDGRPAPAERPAWARHGWFEAVRDWIGESFSDLGMARPDAIVPVRHWGASAVMRVDVGEDRYWFKATIPLFRAEAGITMALAAMSDGMTPQVIAADTDRNWSILEDLGETEASSPAEGVAAVDALVGLQHTMMGRVDELRALGCPDRGLDTLGGDLDRALRSPIVVDRFGVDDVTRHRVERRVAEAVAAIESMGFPTTLIHGDLHPGNVAITDRGPVIFDWSDACIGSPVVDIGPWSSWFDDEPELDEALWGWYRTAWEREFGVDIAGLRRVDVDTVAGAFHLVSFLRIIETLESFRQDELTDGLDFFYARMHG